MDWLRDMDWCNMSIKLHGLLVCLALYGLGITSGSQMDACKSKCS